MYILIYIYICIHDLFFSKPCLIERKWCKHLPHTIGHTLEIGLPSGKRLHMENGHRNSGFSHRKWRFTKVMLVYQRVTELLNQQSMYSCIVELPIQSMYFNHDYVVVMKPEADPSWNLRTWGIPWSSSFIFSTKYNLL